jgi:hypothetical protein
VYTQQSIYFEIFHRVSHLHKAGKFSVAGHLAWPDLVMRLLLQLLRSLLYLVSVTGISHRQRYPCLSPSYCFVCMARQIVNYETVESSVIVLLQLHLELHCHCSMTSDCSHSLHTYTFVRRAGTHWFWLWCDCYCCHKFKLCSPFCDVILECCCVFANNGFCYCFVACAPCSCIQF